MKTFCIDENSVTVIMISFLVTFNLGVISMEIVLIFKNLLNVVLHLTQRIYFLYYHCFPFVHVSASIKGAFQYDTISYRATVLSGIQWTHLHRFANDLTSKFHLESSSIFHRFWKANPREHYDNDSTWKLWRGLYFKNRRNIDEFST